MSQTPADTAVGPPRSVTEMLRTLAVRQPDAPMLTQGDRTLTWGECYRRARRMSQALVAEGKAAGSERKTFIYVNNRLEGNALETIEAMLS